MKNEDLNNILIKHFPLLKVKYYEEVSWQEDDKTGCHVVFGDVFTPYIIDCIKADNINELLKIFIFIEKLLQTNDKYVEEVIALSIFEGIESFFDDREYLLDFLGEKSKKLWYMVNAS